MCSITGAVKLTSYVDPGPHMHLVDGSSEHLKRVNDLAREESRRSTDEKSGVK